MKTASEYRQHAAECRAIAATLQGDARQQLLRMAAKWEELARDRGEPDPPLGAAGLDGAGRR